MVALPRTPSQPATRARQPGFTLAFDVYVISQRLKVLLSEAMADAPLTPDQFAVYSVVREDAPATQTRLAEALGMPVTTFADYVRSMERRGHIVRVPDPSDRRASLLTLSAAGIEAHERSQVPFLEAHRRLEAALTVPVEAVATMLEELGVAIDGAIDQ